MLEKRKIIITGASKGIGRSIANKFAENKFDIFLISSNKNNLSNAAKEIKKKYGVKVNFCATNLKKEEGCNYAIQEIKTNFNDFDTL